MLWHWPLGFPAACDDGRNDDNDNKPKKDNNNAAFRTADGTTLIAENFHFRC